MGASAIEIFEDKLIRLIKEKSSLKTGTLETSKEIIELKKSQLTQLSKSK